MPKKGLCARSERLLLRSGEGRTPEPQNEQEIDERSTTKRFAHIVANPGATGRGLGEDREDDQTCVATTS